MSGLALVMANLASDKVTRQQYSQAVSHFVAYCIDVQEAGELMGLMDTMGIMDPLWEWCHGVLSEGHRPAIMCLATICGHCKKVFKRLYRHKRAVARQAKQDKKDKKATETTARREGGEEKDMILTLQDTFCEKLVYALQFLASVSPNNIEGSGTKVHYQALGTESCI